MLWVGGRERERERLSGVVGHCTPNLCLDETSHSLHYCLLLNSVISFPFFHVFRSLALLYNTNSCDKLGHSTLVGFEPQQSIVLRERVRERESSLYSLLVHSPVILSVHRLSTTQLDAFSLP